MSGLFCCFIRLDRLSQVLSHYNRWYCKTKRLQEPPITIVYTLQNIKFKTFNVFHIPNNMSYATEARILKTESIAINVSHKF